MAKSHYKGVYLNKSNGRYYYATRVKTSTGDFKSVKSKSIYTSAILCYAELQKLKSTIFDEPLKVKESSSKTTKKPLIKNNIINNTSYNNYNSSSLYCLGSELLSIYNKTKRANTVRSKKLTLNSIYNYFGKDKCISDINSNDIIDFIAYLKNKNLVSIGKVISTLKQLIERAFYSSYITQQQYGAFKLDLATFNAGSIVNPNKREKTFYTLEEYQKLQNVIDNDFDKLIFDVLFYGGFRISEFLAIQFKDLDVENHAIKINKQLNTTNDGFAPVKNKNGNRTTIINKAVFNRLYDYCIKNGLLENDIIFSMSRLTIARKVRIYCKLANVPYLNPHGFRHSCCSYLFQVYIKNNMVPNFQFIASQLGDSVAMVQTTYSHLYESENEKMQDLI